MAINTTTWQTVTMLLRSAFGELSTSHVVGFEPLAAPTVLKGSEEEFREFLDHNELELAWDALAELGNHRGGRTFWQKLSQAAHEMELSGKEAEASRRAMQAA